MAQMLLGLFFATILLSGIYAVSQKKNLFVVACILALPTLAGRWSIYFISNPSLTLVGNSFSVLFFAFMAVTILAHVLRDKKVTTDTINGAICTYLMIGLTWASLFSVIESIHPGSFDFSQPQTSSADATFLYYSFTTLTTLGYGDIAPMTAPVRALSFLEAIIGQIYLTVLIARLVGLHIVHSSKGE